MTPLRNKDCEKTQANDNWTPAIQTSFGSWQSETYWNRCTQPGSRTCSSSRRCSLAAMIPGLPR